MYVELKNVVKTYDAYPAADHIDLAIEEGRLVALLGPSGSGKTTILRMIAGLEHQDSGDIVIDGRIVNDVPGSQRGIGFVFQNYALFKYMTVYDNIAFGLEIQKRDKQYIQQRVEELLSFSRLQSGVKLECQRLDLVAEVTDAALFMQPGIEKEGLRLVYEEPELPLPIWADPARLRQVFVNVLDNAVKYSCRGGAITIDLLQEGENAYVTIADQGRGILPEDLENVKLKFFKGKGAVRGSGIGLAVVDEIMTALDGSADIDSQPGVGTTVTLRLPLYRPGHGEEKERS